MLFDKLKVLKFLRKKVKSEIVSYSVISDSATPGSSVHGILQARILEWVAISSSRESS